jgi:hypothetical protein
MAFVTINSADVFNGWKRLLELSPINLHFVSCIVKNKFFEELIVFFPLTQHGPQRKRRIQRYFAAVTSLLSGYQQQADTQTDARFQQFFYCCAYSLPLERVYRAVA